MKLKEWIESMVSENVVSVIGFIVLIIIIALL